MATNPEVADEGQDAAGQIPYPSEGVAWYVVLILMIVYVFSFIDRQILALLVGPIRADLDITDKVFHDDNMLRYSLAISSTAAGIGAILLLSLGLKHFRNSIAHRDEWHAAQSAEA